MRGAVLYARSRRLPAMLATTILGTAAIWLLARAFGRPGAGVVAAVIVLGVSILAAGLTGPDPDLDRTAAISWPPRRAAHALLIGIAVATTVLGGQLIVGRSLPSGLVVRDTAGLLGAALLAATVLGARLSWTLPVGWFVIAGFLPREPGTAVTRVATWMLQPGTGPEPTWTALGLLTLGAACYLRNGNRR